MFNTVTKYLWGSSCDHGQEYADNDKLKQHHGTGEHLDVRQEEDWLVVNADDKENSGKPANSGHRHQHVRQHRGTAHHSQSAHAIQDSLSQNSPNASDTEFLDDAAALAQSISTGDLSQPLPDPEICSESVLSPLHDCGWSNQDIDRCSDTESLPESVFSACSGRSHATYHPCGSRSEAWVVAPPPCFTGSQVGGLSPVASSPLENLLIEHPSMSVYLSFPPSHPILSSHPLGETLPNSLREETERPDDNEEQEQILSEQTGDRDNQNEAHPNAVQQRNAPLRMAADPGLLSPQQLLKNAHLAEHLQCIKVKQIISRGKCERQNKVREYQGHAKGSNRRNKRIRPSGFKSSRFSQHM